MTNLRVVATSHSISNLSSEFIARGYCELKQLGFHVTEAKNLYKNYGHAAGTIDERVDAFHEAIMDTSIDVIMSFWGGFQTHQLLEFLDYDKILKTNKFIIGYSDLSSLLVAIFCKTGLVTYLGPAVVTFSKPCVPDYTKHFFMSLIDNFKQYKNFNDSNYLKEIFHAEQISINRYWQEPEREMIFQKSSGWKCYRHGIASGRIIAGNLGTLMLIYGTEFFPYQALKNAILFIEEDENEKPETIDRYFTELRHRGAFKLISGLVIGRFSEKIFHDDDNFEMILHDALRDYNFPVFHDVDFGHTDPMFTLPIGGFATLNTKEKQIIIFASKNNL